MQVEKVVKIRLGGFLAQELARDMAVEGITAAEIVRRAMTLLVDKGFREEDFASLHPGGKIGKRLMRVEHLMHAGKQCPIVTADTRMRDVIYEMSSKGLGMTCVVDGDVDVAVVGQRHETTPPRPRCRSAEGSLTAAPCWCQPST